MNDPHIEAYHDFSFDDSLSGIPYPPWIGRGYTTTENRILIVPESIYDWNQGSLISRGSLSKPCFVRHCVREIGLYFSMNPPWAGSATQPLYRGIERLLWSEKLVTNEQKLILWTSIAFHEFVQRPMENIKARPKREDLAAGSEILSKVIAILKPRLCVFLGTDSRKLAALEQRFVGVKARWSGRKINGAYPKTVSLDSVGMDCNIVMVKHPSARFSWNLWAEYLMENSAEIVSEFREQTVGSTKPPLRMPASGTPVADAPVAPPPGIAGL